MMLGNLDWVVMDTITMLDDWVSIEQISPRINAFCGLVETITIARTLTRLVAVGLLRIACAVNEGCHVPDERGERLVVEPESILENPTRGIGSA